MTTAQTQSKKPPLVKPLVLGIAAWTFRDSFGPLMDHDVINPPAAALAVFYTTAMCVGTAHGVGLIAGVLSIIHARIPKGHKGKAHFASWRDVRKDVKHYGWGPYWGYYQKYWWSKKRVIIADYESNALTIGSAGSGKGVGVVLPTCLSIRDSKLLLDYKGSNSCMLYEPLTKRGESVYTINIGDMHPDILKATNAFYNPANIIHDGFIIRGGLQHVVNDAYEMAHQLHPYPAEKGHGDAEFWISGAQDDIVMAQIQMVLVHGENATFGHANQLLNDRAGFLKEMQWVAGGRLLDADGEPLPPMPLERAAWTKHHDHEDVANFVAWYRAKAGTIADLLAAPDPRMADSFLKGAQQALSVFDITSHANKVLSKSTIRFSEMKNGKRPVTIAIIIDPTRRSSQDRIAALLQKCAITELMRHKNTRKPVYFICDETSNFKIHQLPSLLSYSREYSIKLHLFLQNISGFRTTYGKEAVNALLSETEIKQFLPNCREPETLELIEKYLGHQSYIASNSNLHTGDYGLKNHGYSEDGKPVMSQEEIRRMKHSLLIIRNNRVAKSKNPTIAAIHPWRRQVGINPFFRKRYLKWITLCIGSRKRPIVQTFFVMLLALAAIYLNLTGGMP